MITNYNNTSAVHSGGPNQEVVNKLCTLAPGAAREWLKQLCKHYGFVAELAQYRNCRMRTQASFADIRYDTEARKAKLHMSQTVLYSKTLQINRLAHAHGLPPVLNNVNKGKSEAASRILSYAEDLVAQSPYAKHMNSTGRVKQGTVNKLIVLEPKKLAYWTKQVCRLYGLVAEIEQYWILGTHLPFLLTDVEYDFEDRSRRLQAEADAICKGILIVNDLAYAHGLPTVVPIVGDDSHETIAYFLSYVENLVALSSSDELMHVDDKAA